MSDLKPIESIRQKNRGELNVTRKERRFRALQRPGLSKSYTPEVLNEMAIRLRKKKDSKKEFLTELSEVLGEKQHAIIVMGVDGVLQALCSFLTGNDSSLQLEAVYCLANAALWEDDEKNTSPIGSAVGAYLMTLIGSGSPSLQEACCWAISNLLPQGKTVVNALDLTENITKLFVSPFENVRSSAIQCLVQFTRTCSPEPKDLIKISSNLKLIVESKTFDSTSFAWLLFILSGHNVCDDSIFNSTLIDWSLNQLSIDQKFSNVIPLVRYLSNAACFSSHPQFADPNFIQTICCLLNSPYEAVRKETFLFVCNVVNTNNGMLNVFNEHALGPSLVSVAKLYG